MTASRQPVARLLVPPGVQNAAMKSRLHVRLGLPLALLALAGCGAGLRADDAPHDDVLAAVRRGEIRPLAEIEAKLRAERPGEILKVEIERKNGAFVYEFRILGPDGRRREIHVDARTGDILDRRRR